MLSTFIVELQIIVPAVDDVEGMSHVPYRKPNIVATMPIYWQVKHRKKGGHTFTYRERIVSARKKHSSWSCTDRRNKKE